VDGDPRLTLLAGSGLAETQQVTRSAGAGAMDGALPAGGYVNWTNTGAITASDDARAGYLFVGDCEWSRYLRGTQFGFSVPANAQLLGIQARIERCSGVYGEIEDKSVRLIQGGAIAGDEKGKSIELTQQPHWWPTLSPPNEAYESYGGAADLWGLTWTPAQVNAADFGVGVAVSDEFNCGGGTSGYVDHVEITVYYVIPFQTWTMGIDQSAAGNWTLASGGVLGAGADRLIAAPSGDVGIGGDTTPDARLDVDANQASNYAARFANDGNNANRWGLYIQSGANNAAGVNHALTAADGDGTVEGYLDIHDGTFELVQASDARLKREIRPAARDGLAAIRAVAVRDFTREGTTATQTGFVAQELAQAAPEAVRAIRRRPERQAWDAEQGTTVTLPAEEALGIVPDRLIPILWDAVRRQQSRIDALEARLEQAAHR
jgi:hypothetical protein